MDLDFLLRNLVIVIGLTLVALVMNTLINMLTLRVVGESWLDSLRAGASLAQLGEFGFVLAALGLATGVIVDEGYQYVLFGHCPELVAESGLDNWYREIKRALGEDRLVLRPCKPRA